MLTRMSVIIIVLILVGTTPAFAVERICRIANQSDSPITITAFEARLQQGSGDYWNGNQQGIYQIVEYKNVSGRQIVAIQISFFHFDVWNEPMGRMNYSSVIYSSGELIGAASDVVEDIEPNKVNRLVNIANFDNPNLFLTGIVGITKVRFANGEVWKAETKDIVMQLSDIIPDIEKRFFTPSS